MGMGTECVRGMGLALFLLATRAGFAGPAPSRAQLGRSEKLRIVVDKVMPPTLSLVPGHVFTFQPKE